MGGYHAASLWDGKMEVPGAWEVVPGAGEVVPGAGVKTLKERPSKASKGL